MKRVLGYGLGRLAAVAIILVVMSGALAMPAAAQFRSVASFNGTDGSYPQYGPLVQGRDGNYYGTTAGGGAYGYGEVFKVTAAGAVTTIYSFCPQSGNCIDGEGPVAGLVLGTDGNFYGTTLFGGDMNGCGFPYGCGTVFKLTPKGVLTTLYTFETSSGGDGPMSGLVEGNNGNFYGTTNYEGGDGMIFKITPKGVLTALHTFEEVDGMLPFGGLTLGTDGNFYGTTSLGGTSTACNDGCGTVFKMTPAGKLTTLHSFSVTDGANPIGGLVQASNGNFYGTTAAGGANEAMSCGQDSNPGCGTVFEITPQGKLTTLHSFCSEMNCADGYDPYGTLVQGTDSNLYGTTTVGGLCCGMIFMVSPGGTFAPVYSLCDQHAGCVEPQFDGFLPWAGLLLSTRGILYGTTYYGGTSSDCPYGCGTVFSESVGLGQFVEAVTNAGKVGATIEFLGQGFTASTTVSFNGTAATPTVKSGTYLTAVVPSGATTGFVTITTSKGTLTSNKVFRVIQ